MKRFLIVLFTLLVTASGHAAPAGKKQAPPPAPARPVVTEEAAVVLDGVELFRIRHRVLSLSPEERAHSVNARLARLAETHAAPPVPVTVLDGETSSDLAAGEIMIHGGYRRSLRPSYCKLRSTISTSFTN
jgi:hypothetical protein